MVDRPPSSASIVTAVASELSRNEQLTTSTIVGATPINEQPQETPMHTDETATQSTSVTASPTANPSAMPTSESDAEAGRGASGFSALVGAFMNGFRQSMRAQQRQRTQGTTANEHVRPSSQTEQTEASSLSFVAADIQPSLINDTNAATAPFRHVASHGLADEESLQDGRESRGPAAAPSSSDAEAAMPSSGPGENPSDGRAPQTLFFRMPLHSRTGQSAVLAFTPGPIPVPATPETPSPAYGPQRPMHLGPEHGNALASGFHLPNAPIFVPHGASPLPFSFLFDAQTNTAWPIAALSFGPPGSMPPASVSPDTPQFMAGPPFHIALNISFGPSPEAPRPDPERALRFVSSLERADSELRARMARLGLGDIGDYGGRQDNEGGHEAALGCGICLDEYSAEDRPEWIGGQTSVDEEVVAVPCAGHHTLHHHCLYEWLSKTPPGLWTCPFCRAPLDKDKVDQSATSSRSATTMRSAADEGKEAVAAEAALIARSLRDEVRLRERAQGWRCDAPACLPRYPDRKQDVGKGSKAVQRGESIIQAKHAAQLIALLPCRHEMHVDCLCTSMRLEQIDAASEDEEGEEEEDDEEEEEEDGGDGDNDDDHCAAPRLPDSPANVKESAMVGKWVKCSLCRHEAWAELPVRRRPKRGAATAS